MNTKQELFFIEPIVAYRLWRLVDNGGSLSLRSLFKDTHWIPFKKIEARCYKCTTLIEPDATFYYSSLPLLQSLCKKCGKYQVPGIYSFRNTLYQKLCFNSLVVTSSQYIVKGEIYIWGEIIEHERGYISEYAYPKSFRGCFNLKAWNGGKMMLPTKMTPTDSIDIEELNKKYGLTS